MRCLGVPHLAAQQQHGCPLGIPARHLQRRRDLRRAVIPARRRHHLGRAAIQVLPLRRVSLLRPEQRPSVWASASILKAALQSHLLAPLAPRLILRAPPLLPLLRLQLLLPPTVRLLLRQRLRPLPRCFLLLRLALRGRRRFLGGETRCLLRAGRPLAHRRLPQHSHVSPESPRADADESNAYRCARGLAGDLGAEAHRRVLRRSALLRFRHRIRPLRLLDLPLLPRRQRRIPRDRLQRLRPTRCVRKRSS